MMPIFVAPLAFALVAQAAPAADPVELRAPAIDVGSAFPAAETTVPANGRLVFFGTPDATIEFVRTLGDGSEQVLARDAIIALDPFTSAHVVLVPDDVVVGETIVISSRCNAGCSFQAAWTIADDDVTAPEFNDGPARVTADHIDPQFGASGGGGGYVVTVELPGATDARSATLIELRGDLTHLSPQPFAATGPATLFVETLDDTERTACFLPVAIDAAGNEAEFREELCVELKRPIIGGCSQSSASTSTAAVAMALALLGVMARRRRR